MSDDMEWPASRGGGPEAAERDDHSYSDGSSQRSGDERSYYSDEGSYRSGSGSYSQRSGSGSHYSQRSGSYRDEGSKGSYYSQDDRSQGSRSYYSGDDRSQGSRSYYSEDDRSRGSRSYSSRSRSRSPSQHSGSYRSRSSEGSQGSRSYYSDEERSVDSRGRPYSDGGSGHSPQHDSGEYLEDGSYHSRGSRSYDSRGSQGSRSYDSRGSRGSRSYDSRGSRGSRSYYSEDDRSRGSRSYSSRSRSPAGSQGSRSYYSDEDRSVDSRGRPYSDASEEENRYPGPQKYKGDVEIDQSKNSASTTPSFAVDSESGRKSSQSDVLESSEFDSFATDSESQSGNEQQVRPNAERKLPYHQNFSKDSDHQSSSSKSGASESFANDGVDSQSDGQSAAMSMSEDRSMDFAELLEPEQPVFESSTPKKETPKQSPRKLPFHQNAQQSEQNFSDSQSTPSSHSGEPSFADETTSDDYQDDDDHGPEEDEGQNMFGSDPFGSGSEDDGSFFGNASAVSKGTFQSGTDMSEGLPKITEHSDEQSSVEDAFGPSGHSMLGDEGSFGSNSGPDIYEGFEHPIPVRDDNSQRSRSASGRSRSGSNQGLRRFSNTSKGSQQSPRSQRSGSNGDDQDSRGRSQRSRSASDRSRSRSRSRSASGSGRRFFVGEGSMASGDASLRSGSASADDDDERIRSKNALSTAKTEASQRLRSLRTSSHSDPAPSPSLSGDPGDQGESGKRNKRKKKLKIRKPKVNEKSEALLELVANVNSAMMEIENEQNRSDWAEGKEMEEADSTAKRLLHGFEALVGILLQLSDELELLSTFARQKNVAAVEALNALLDFAPLLDEHFTELRPVLSSYMEGEIDDEMNDLLYGLNMVVDLLCELTHRVAERQEWSARANTSFVTLLELLARDTLEVNCCHDDVDTPDYNVSELLQVAWDVTGHVEEFKTLQVTNDLSMFRQICYEVMLSTDQWCPDTGTLMDICGVDTSILEEEGLKPSEDDILWPIPEPALQILEKINGEGLPRIPTLASILRRILPAQAIADPVLLDNFASIRSTIQNPLGMAASSMIAISSVPETLDDPNALGFAGVGKTTLAAMVAEHEDVRRFFTDGIAWVYVGQKELSYSRYVHCLRDLLVQLDVPEVEEPLFPELLHTPGESISQRRRREEGFMIYVREAMADFLEFRNVLIILDDVCFEPDLDWFDFAPGPDENGQEPEGTCVVLLTTRVRDMLPAADTVEVDMLEEGEAVELLIQESGELSHALVAESPETRSVVLECANHPLAVKSVGRWLNLKHATAGVVSSVEEIHEDVVRSMDKILKSGKQENADMMYEILNMSLSPAINGEPTNVIKFCFAAFVLVLCDRKHISEFALSDATPIVPAEIAELLFEALLELEEESLLQEGSLFHAQKKEAATLIPEALCALGVFKGIITYSESEEDGSQGTGTEEKYLQVMHKVQQEYGEYLCEEEESLQDLTKDAEVRWNKAFAEAFLSQDNIDWDAENPDAGVDYALEMMPIHMIRGSMFAEAVELLTDENFVRGRLFALGRENATRRHLKDCELLFDLAMELRLRGKKTIDAKASITDAYRVLGELLTMDEDEYIAEEGSPEAIEVARSHIEIGNSLAEKRCWEAAITHWESAQELVVSSLGMVEIVAGILYNVGVVYSEMNEYEQALGSLKQCLRIRGAIHGEEHTLYALTIQKIGDIFLSMSDYHEAMESYNWALDVMHIEPAHFRCDIGNILECMGCVHYSKGEIEESLQSYQDALRSKQVDLGEDHPELASTFQHIGNCLSDQGRTDEAIAHFEEAIRLMQLDPDGGAERDADVLTIEGVLRNLNGQQQEGLECYEKSLQLLVTKVPHKKEKVASLLHLIGCVYLMNGEHKKAMKLFEESLQARRKVLGYVHLDVASTLFNMAFLHQSRNRLDKALKCLEEALKIRQLRLPDGEKVAVTHEKIGTLARSIGKAKKAELAFGEVLRIRKLIHGESHEAVATVLQELGDLMDDLGEYDEAMKYYVEALDIRQTRLGPDDLAVAETFYSMGFTLQNNGAADRAFQCFEESLSIRKFQLGDDAKDVGDTLNMLGFLQAQRGDLDDALSLLWDALRIRKLQEDHIKVSETLKNIGNVHREKEEHDLAIECYEECLRIRRSELGDNNEKVADALIAIGNVHSDTENSEDAMYAFKEALMIRTTIFGEHDECVAAVLQYMGALEFRNENLERALQLLMEFIRIRQDNGSEHDGDYVNVLFMVGNIHKMQGDEEEAQKCWKEAYKVFKELGLAEGNPQIASVMSSLVGEEEPGPDATQDDREQYQQDLQKRKNQLIGLLGKLTDKVTEVTSGVRGRSKDHGGLQQL